MDLYSISVSHQGRVGTPRFISFANKQQKNDINVLDHTYTHSLSSSLSLSLSHTRTHYNKINIIIIIIKNNTTKAHLWEVKSFFHACTTFGSLKRHKIAIPYNSLKSPKNSLSNTPFKTGFAGFSDNRRNNLTPELEVSDSWGGAGNWGLTWLDQKLTSTSFRCGTKSETRWKRNQKERLEWSLETKLSI